MDGKIQDFLLSCGIKDIDAFVSKCILLKEFLYEENSKYNLTRIKDDFEYWNRHIADSASIGLFFTKKLMASNRIADIGCGAGFPSMVMALIYPNQHITAIDSIGKKTNFVKMASEKLGLSNIEVVTARSNELKLPQKFDIITARAVAEPSKILKETRHLLAPDGNYILYQTPSEIEALKSAVSVVSAKFGFKWHLSEPFTLPSGENRIFLYTSRR